MKNEGEKPFMLHWEDPLRFFFRFIVIRTVGVNSWVVPLTAIGKDQLSPDGHMNAIRGGSLFPGNELRGEIFLSTFYDMAGPGVYKVVCYVDARPHATDPPRPRMVSKALLITVTE